MKTYEQMAESVRIRAQKEKENRRRKNRIIISVVCAAILILGTAWFLMPDNPLPEQAVQGIRSKFVIVGHAAEEKPLELIKDVQLPSKCIILVRDVRGLNEWERVLAELEEQNTAREFWGKGNPVKTCLQSSSKNVITTVSSAGTIRLLCDYGTVESVDIQTTEKGRAWIGSQGVYEGYNNYDVRWFPSETACAEIDKNPQLNLSTLSFQLTITVKFKDGATETAIIDMVIDDDGNVYAIQRGITVAS